MSLQNQAPFNHSQPTARRRGFLLGGGVAAAAVLAFSVFAFAAPDSKPSVSVKVDDKPLNRTAPSANESYAPIIKQVSPSVVKVLVTARAKNVPMQGNPFFNDSSRGGMPDFFFGPSSPFGGQQGRQGRSMQRIPQQNGLGSGVIVSTDGYVLTNSHVVAGADEIKISLDDGREFKAKLVGNDPKTDLAVVKVDAKDLPAATFSDSDALEVGDRVLAIGNPYGIGQTVTSGMVSGLGRGVGILDDVEGYEDFIQTDASINPGNSGGALTDVRGRVIGINTAILSRTGGFQGIGLAIPSNLARTVMEQLVTNGKVVRGFIGVSVQGITPVMVDQFKLKNRDGALVADVTAGSPADKAGIKAGDVIVEFNGRAVKDGRTLKLAVAGVAPGSESKMVVVRDGKNEKLSITVGNQPRDRNASGKGGRGDRGYNQDIGTLNGVAVMDLDTRTRREFDIPSHVRGALVTEVDPASASAAAGLQPGDVIQEINRKPVANAEDAISLTENTDSKITLLLVWNQRGTRFVSVDESDDSSASE